MFEEWCEGYDNVKHVYKNGDKSESFFSIVYRRAFRWNHFYPDYIIQNTVGKIWILEANGGMTADGSSNNIEKYAGKKFEALKESCSRHPELKWSFVRAVGTCSTSVILNGQRM